MRNKNAPDDGDLEFDAYFRGLNLQCHFSILLLLSSLTWHVPKLIDVEKIVNLKAPVLTLLCSNDYHFPPKGSISFWTELSLPSLKPMPESLYILT